MSQLPGNVAKQVVSSSKLADAGHFITVAEGQSIVMKAKLWKGTPYGTGIYAGGNPVKASGADCSGSVWKIYQEAGFSYGSYTNTAGFMNLAGDDTNFIQGKHFFKLVSLPQVGDVGWWHNGKGGHMAIYDPNSGMCGQENKTAGNVWSASNARGPAFGAAHSSWYDKDYKIHVKWFRFWKSST